LQHIINSISVEFQLIKHPFLGKKVKWFSSLLKIQRDAVACASLIVPMHDFLREIYEFLSSTLIDHHQSNIIQTDAPRFISAPMLPATSDRVRVDRKFNCVTRQCLIHGSGLPLVPCVVTARNYRPMRRAIDPGDHLFSTVYLNPKALELTWREPIAEVTFNPRASSLRDHERLSLLQLSFLIPAYVSFAFVGNRYNK